MFWILCFASIFVRVFHIVHCQTCTTVDEWLGDNLVFTSTFYCYGYQCCANTTISTSSTVGYCNAARGCIYSDIDLGSVLSCGGYLGCAFATRIDSYVFFFVF